MVTHRNQLCVARINVHISYSEDQSQSNKDFYNFSLSLCIYVCAHPHAWQCTRCVDGTSSILLLWTPFWNPWKLQGHRTSLSQIRGALLTTLVSQRAPISRVQMDLGQNSPSLPGFWLAAAQFFQVGWAETLRKSCTKWRIIAAWKRTVFMELQWEFMTFLPKALWGPSQAMEFSAKNLTVTFAWASSMQGRHYFSLQYNQVGKCQKTKHILVLVMIYT